MQGVRVSRQIVHFSPQMCDPFSPLTSFFTSGTLSTDSVFCPRFKRLIFLTFKPMTKTTAETIPLRVFGQPEHQLQALFRNPKNAHCHKFGLQGPYDAIVKLHECDVTALADLPIVEGTLATAGVKFATHDEIISLAVVKPELLAEYRLATIIDGKICLVWNTRGYNEINFSVHPGKLIRKEVPLLLVFACRSK